jgi:hypothetical protein
LPSAAWAADGFRYDLSGLALLGLAPPLIRELPCGGALADEELSHGTAHESFGLFVKQDRPLKALVGEHPPGSGLVLKVNADGHDQKRPDQETQDEADEHDGGYQQSEHGCLLRSSGLPAVR